MKIRQAKKIMRKWGASNPPLWSVVPDKVLRADQRLNRYRRCLEKQRGQARYGPSPLQPVFDHIRDLGLKIWMDSARCLAIPRSILYSPQLDSRPPG